MKLILPATLTRIALLAILSIILISCRKDDAPKDEVLKSNRGLLISAVLLDEYTQSEVDTFMASFNPAAPLLFPAQNGVKVYRLIYETLDAHDNPITASGALIIPTGLNDTFPLISYQHGTVTMRSDAPSFNGTELLIGMNAGSTGYVAVIADYIGLGQSPGMHPYIHAKTEASAVIDMLRAAKSFCAAKRVPLNGQLFMFGYSQGGHATMAAVREIEANHASEFTITACAPMSGPYDTDSVQAEVIISEEPYPDPSYLPYITFAYQSVYGNIYDKLENSLKAPYYETLPPLFDGEHTGSEVNALMPEVPSQIVLTSELDRFKTDMNHPLRVALRDNDLTQWTPKAPMRICYCEGDKHVSYRNAIVAYESFIARGATQVEKFSGGASNDHGTCVLPSLVNVKIWFDSLKR